MASDDIFQTVVGFCHDCGSILPPLREKGGVKCYTCGRDFSGKDFKWKNSYTVHFNSRDNPKSKTAKKSKENDDEGPLVDRKCSKCGHTKMSYATVQLRSADEGQTVFYTCTKCKFKESENS